MGFSPVSMFLDELQRRYDRRASFFVDVVGGHVIGFKWSSQAFEATPFDVKLAHMLEPIDGQRPGHIVQDCAMSVSAVLADMAALGAGLVQHITVLRQ